MRCGDPCDIVTEPPKSKTSGRKIGRTFKEKPCCGSRGPRHKAGCTNTGAARAANGPTKPYSCDDCSAEFDHYPNLGVAKCQECGSENCWPKT